MINQEKRDRTRATLKNALIELCDEKSYYDITIWDICNKAHAYRSTYYRYFDTKDDVLREIEHEYLETTRSLNDTTFCRFTISFKTKEAAQMIAANG